MEVRRTMRITGARDAYKLVAGKLRDGSAALGKKEKLLAIILLDEQLKVRKVVYTKADITKVDGMLVAIHHAQEAFKEGGIAGLILAIPAQYPYPTNEMLVCVSEYRKALNLLHIQLVDVLTIAPDKFYSFADE